MKSTRDFVCRFAHRTDGNIAIVMALALPVLVGFAGLGAEAGYWFFEQRRLQASADLAAYAGAVAARAGGADAQITSVAELEAGLHGFRPASGDIAVNRPPLSGAFMNARSVEVELEQEFARYFSAIFIDDPLLISVRAVAAYDEPGAACILALHETAPQAMLFSGNSTTRFSGCDLMSNSLADDAITIQGSVEVTASCVNSAGGLDNTATLILEGCPAARLHMPRAPDPYADVPPPTIPATCATNTTPRQPGKYCGGMDLSGTLTLTPGVYIVSGGALKINGNSNITGHGVTFYLTNGATVQMNGTAAVDLRAPTSGTYSGLLFYADPASTATSAKFNGTANSALIGALYFPVQPVEVAGDFTESGGCTRIVSHTIKITGNPNFQSDCSGTGINDPKVPGAVRLVE